MSSESEKMTEEKFMEIVSEALAVDVAEITLDTKMYDVENWDSLGQLNILTALEEATDGKASSINNLGNMTKLSDMFDAVKSL